MFDWVEIVVKAGDGGNGVVSFRREKFVPFGGPNGGDGGNGGDVIIRADSTITNLRAFKQKRFYRAGAGEDGKSKRQHGKGGEKLVLKVPVGTLLLSKTQLGDNVLIDDLEHAGQEAVVAKGGEGGLGNVHFASSTNQAPQVAQKGSAGEGKAIILEMRLIADVGIIGYPNVGKSTLLTAASAAKPKIASYPFTTREPILGMVEVGQARLVLAEIPGLIDGAHLGRGLGHDFLRHSLRTKILIHLIDGSSESPVEDLIRVNAELSLFDSALAQKPQLVAINKIDLPQVRQQVTRIKDAFSTAGTTVFFVSAATGEGVNELLTETVELLKDVSSGKETSMRVPKKVFRPQPQNVGASVRKEGDTFVVEVPGLERIIARMDMTSREARQQLRKQLVRSGASKRLEKAGIKPGDRVRCGDLEWEW